MQLQSLARQRQAKVAAELLRGSGNFEAFPHPVDLEPPFEPFVHGQLTDLDMTQLGIDGPFEPNPLLRLLRRIFGSPDGGTKFHLPEYERKDDLVTVGITLPRELEISLPQAEQLLLGIKAREPAAFEIVGTRSGISLQLIAGQWAAEDVVFQIYTQHPDVPCTLGAEDALTEALGRTPRRADVFLREYALDKTHCHPLASPRDFKVDPLSVAIGAMTEIPGDHWAIVQILWKPVVHEWDTNMRIAARDELDPSKPAAGTYPDLTALETKLDRPLFAVAIRLSATQKPIIERLEAFLQQYEGRYNAIRRCPSPQGETIKQVNERIYQTLVQRQSYRLGIILNSEELAGLVHLPAKTIHSEKLPRETRTTAPAPDLARQSGIELGQNRHRGTTTPVHLPDSFRSRHVYLVGATRTGKSTLILNMVVQDMNRGAGLGVIDPHGDLIRQDILPRVPEERLKDVVYFNPDDRDFPIAFNALQVGSDRERELVCNDLIVAFQRLFGDNWGIRMEHILRYLVLTLLERPSSTLRDIRRLIDDEAFRYEVVPKVTDPEVRDFWEYEFGTYGNNAFSPIRNKLGKFLAYPTIRNMLLQPEPKVDFRQVMDQGRILLCNLSQGQLGEDVSGILGSLLVSRLQIAAMARAGTPMEQRRDFHLYVDEFQNYVTSSFDKILSEAGKYRLNLVLANQFLKQLPDRLQSGILDNVGTLVCFRTGADAASRLAKDLGQFQAEDLLDLERGETVVRMGSARDAFNMATCPPPERPEASHEAEIIAHSRASYATPRADVEALFTAGRGAPGLDSVDDFFE